MYERVVSNVTTNYAYRIPTRKKPRSRSLCPSSLSTSRMRERGEQDRNGRSSIREKLLFRSEEESFPYFHRKIAAIFMARARAPVIKRSSKRRGGPEATGIYRWESSAAQKTSGPARRDSSPSISNLTGVMSPVINTSCNPPRRHSGFAPDKILVAR